MPACQICLTISRDARFATSRLNICHRCVDSLNEWREPAESAYDDVEEGLRRGLRKRLGTSATHAEIEHEHRANVRGWISAVCANKNRTAKSDRQVRAHRKGLLRRTRPRTWDYPKNWKTLAARVRQLDGFCCVSCKTDCEELHVHHVIYVSNFGTHQLHNLVTLCRSCHENEHERTFDRGEDLDRPDQKPGKAVDTLLHPDLWLAADGPRPPLPRERLLEDCAYILSCLAEDCPGAAKDGFSDLVKRLEADLELPDSFRSLMVTTAMASWTSLRRSRRVECATHVWSMFRAVLDMDASHLRLPARALVLPPNAVATESEQLVAGAGPTRHADRSKDL